MEIGLVKGAIELIEGGITLSFKVKISTGKIGLPWVLALLAILIEVFGSLFLIVGFSTRLAAFAFIVHFAGAVLTSHIHNGFFMNWYVQENKGEGLEYFILLFGLAIVALINGGGKASVDAAVFN